MARSVPAGGGEGDPGVDENVFCGESGCRVFTKQTTDETFGA